MSTTFLTGATGFVGQAVLARLLERTDRRIHTLVRAENQDNADARMRGVLAALYDDVERGGLRRMTYVSTAYVAGTRHNEVREDELDAGQDFRNPYEQSKHEAETMVRKHQRKLPITIARPSIVVGERGTGWTSSFNVIYGPLRAFASGAFPVLPGRSSAIIDVVTVDYVADSVLALTAAPEAEGGTYHLVAGDEA